MVSKLLFLVTLFVSNTIQVITGFAGAMLAMPPSIRLVGVEAAKPIVAIVSGASSVYVAIRYWRDIDFRQLGKITLLMGSGLLLGIWLFDALAFDILLRAYGAVIILIALKKLFVRRELKLPKAALYGCLLIAGLIHGMFISGGSFLVVYAVWAMPEKNKFRATVSAVWVVLNTYLLYSHYRAGYFVPEVLGLLAASAIPFAGAVWLGNKLAKRISAQKFLLLTYILLLISGIVALV